MTREEKSNLLNELLKYEENNDIGNLTRAERREFQQWINKSLEQESILDEIRDEIMQLDYDIDTIDYDQDDMTYSEDIHTIHREEVLQILDKYEGKNVQHDHKKETCLSKDTPINIGPDPFETTIEEDREAE